MTTRELGRIGENAVCQYLTNAGYRILCRNFCIRGGEVDIIADNADYLVFVEVKARKRGSMTSGYDAITPAKQGRILKTAAAYLYRNPTTLQPRFDIAEVTLLGGAVQNLDYIPNAFDTTGFDLIF